jgi:preprotein translocase subunit YajC
VSMVDSLRKGDKVITNGGIFGTIVKVGDDRITLEIASKVQIQIERQQVARMDKKIAESKEDPDDDDAEEKEVKKKVAKKVAKKVTKKVKEED